METCGKAAGSYTNLNSTSAFVQFFFPVLLQDNTGTKKYISSMISGLSFLSYLRPIEAAICWELEILYQIKRFPFMLCLGDPHKI